ncbi:MAG: DUF222 domain-containing protein [Mycobacterium sp.]
MMRRVSPRCGASCRLLMPRCWISKVAAIAATVCDDDPRSIGERRADALGALGNGNHQLPCACESPGCPARAAQPAPKSSVVVNVLPTKPPSTVHSRYPPKPSPYPRPPYGGHGTSVGHRGDADPAAGRIAAQRRQAATVVPAGEGCRA